MPPAPNAKIASIYSACRSLAKTESGPTLDTRRPDPIAPSLANQSRQPDIADNSVKKSKFPDWQFGPVQRNSGQNSIFGSRAADLRISKFYRQFRALSSDCNG